MPRYGLVCIPNRSAKNTTRNTTALTVVSTMPAIDTGLRMTWGGIALASSVMSSVVQPEVEELLLLEGHQVRDQAVDVLVRQLVCLHHRLPRRLELRSHAGSV